MESETKNDFERLYRLLYERDNEIREFQKNRTADHFAKQALRRQRDVAIWIAAISTVALLVKLAV